MISKIKSFISKIALTSIIVGVLIGVLELYIGHKFILDPLLYGVDSGFTYETYFAPTYYGMVKSIINAITFFFVFLLTAKKKMNLLMKSTIVGIIGTILVGIYYYFTFPHVGFYATVLVAIVHFIFIAGISYVISKMVQLDKVKKK